MDVANGRPVRPGAYAILFLLFAAVILLTHLAWLDLPYFWDEAGYYVPEFGCAVNPSARSFCVSGSRMDYRRVSPRVHPLRHAFAGRRDSAGFAPSRH